MTHPALRKLSPAERRWRADHPLVRLRKQSMGSQSALCEAADVGECTMWRIESGRRLPTLGAFFRLASVLGVDPTALYTSWVSWLERRPT